MIHAGFKLFSFFHIAIILSLVIIIILMFAFKSIFRNSKVKNFLRYILAYLLLFVKASEQVLDFIKGRWTVKGSLPLHLCGITSIFCIVMLLTKKYSIFEIMYFWGLIGSPLAIIFPSDLNYSYNSIIFWQFMISHFLNIIIVVFMIIAYKFRPTLKSIYKTFIWTNIYMAFIACFNYTAGSNYYFLYLCKDPAPQFPNPFKTVNSWPIIILLLEAVTILMPLLFYIPYAVIDAASKKVSKENSISGLNV